MQLTAIRDPDVGNAADPSSDVPARAPDPDRHDTLRRALAFIDGNPDAEITIHDLAQAASVSPRAVQLAFRQHLATTPTAYLRAIRLQHAHRQLQEAAGNDEESVTRIAIEAGFASPGRFAGYYRLRYGVSPRTTLHG